MKILKSKTIKERKPNLTLFPNHFHFISTAPLRSWTNKGTAYKDKDTGWFKWSKGTK